MINKRKNLNYSGGIPESLGDRYYSQDFTRDYNFFLDRIGLLIADLKRVPVIISGGAVSQGVGDTLNISSCIAYVKYEVTIPDTFAALPPSTTTGDIEGMRTVADTQVNLAIADATLDNTSWNYVKLLYKDIALHSRSRAKKTGSYDYELQPSYEYVIDTVVPTDYTAVLCKFKGTSGGTFTFDFSERTTSGVDTGMKNGLNIYSGRITGSISSLSLPDGKIYNTIGYIDVGSIAVIEKITSAAITATGMTQGRWHLLYVDIAGNYILEEMTAATYGTLPYTEINTKAPYNLYKTARYKAGDPSQRLIACVYSMPSQTAWDSGTTYSKGMLCSSGGHIYISRQSSNLNNAVSDTSYWYDMGANGAVFAPMVFNFPEPMFGTGGLGDQILSNADIIEVGYDYTDGTWKNLTYHFQNITLEASATVHIGQNVSSALAIPGPVTIKISDTLLFNTASQLNGNAKGITGGAGGNGGTSAGAGGAGASSGYPMDLYVNQVVDLTVGSTYLIDNAPGSGSNGSNGSSANCGGGGGGGASISGLKIIYRSFKSLYENVVSLTLPKSKIKEIGKISIDGNEAGGIGGSAGASAGGHGRCAVPNGSGVSGLGVSGSIIGGIGSGNTIVSNYSPLGTTSISYITPNNGIFVGGNGGKGGGGTSYGSGGGGGITGGGGWNSNTSNANIGGNGGTIGEGGKKGTYNSSIGAGGGGGGLGAGGGGGAGTATNGADGSAPAQSHLQAGGYFEIHQVGESQAEVLI